VVEVNDILQGLRKREPRLDVRSLPVQFEDPPPDSSAGTRIAELGAKACARTAGTGQLKGVPYGTDASQLSLAGIPCIIVGPGSIDQAHTNDEFVSISELQKAVQIYRQIMLDY
jgi:acetylornithine deacetylase